MENKVLSNLFGIAGTILWSVQLVPQIHLNYKRKSTKGVSPVCFGCWYACGLVLGTNLVYNREPPALIVQISLFSLFCLAIVFQHLFYQKKYNQKRLLFTLGLVVLVSIALSISIYSILNADRTNQFVVQLILCITATALMLAGFYPQILEVWEEKVGLSKIFVVMDFFGGVFSILSLVFHVPFDFMAFSTYVVVPICQTIIFILIVKVTYKARLESSKSNSTSFVPFVNSENDDVRIDMDGKELNNINNNDDDNSNKNNNSDNNNNNNDSNQILHSNNEDDEDYDENDKHSSPLRPLNASFNSIHLNFKDPNSIAASGNIIKESQVIPSSTLLNQSTIGVHKSPLSISSSTTVQSPVIQRQELDHVIPLSTLTNSTDNFTKQQQQYQSATPQQQQQQSATSQQQQSLIENSIDQLRTTINNNNNIINNTAVSSSYHGYPVS